MKTYLFKAKKSTINHLVGLLGILCALYVIFNINSNNSFGWVAALAALLVYVSTKNIIRASSNTIIKIMISDTDIQFTYANLKLSPLDFKKIDVQTTINSENILFSSDIRNLKIGEIRKSDMLDKRQWTDLLDEF